MAQDPKNFLGGLVRWDRTSRLKQRIDWKTEEVFHPSLGRVAGYQGHHIIGRDCPVREGVYLGAYEREAIVVTESEPELIRKYVDLLDRLHAKRLNEDEILANVYAFVREEITSESVKELLAAKGIGADQKVSLALFVGHGVGVCRHRALFAAYLLEKLAEQGVIRGRVSVDRNEMPEGSHAWTRFTNANGVATIIDAMLGYCGPITTAKGMPWEYARPDENTSQPRGGDMSNTTRRFLVAVLGLIALLCENAGVGLIMKRSADSALATRRNELQKEFDGYRRLADLNVEEQKRIVEQMKADLDATAATIAKLETDVAALKHELDPDGDGVKIPHDACPESAPASGEPTAVNAKGCLDKEAAFSCQKTRSTVTNGQWEFLDCPLADEVSIAYVCTGTYTNGWAFDECHEFDTAHPGG